MRGALMALCCLLCLSCSHTPAADAIRKAITDISAAAEAQQRANVLGHVSEDFIGNGELDIKQLDSFLRAQMLGAKSLGVRVSAIKIDIQGERAQAQFDAYITDSSGRWIADRAVTLHFETFWRRERGDWRCYNAKWSSDAR